VQQVRDWMTPGPVTVGVTASALEALEQMLERGLRHLPVVTSGRLVGILSREDVRAAVPFALAVPLSPEQRAEGLEYRVGDIMSHAPVTTHPDATLAMAAKLLERHRFGCLPVVDAASKLVGIFTRTDALRALVHLLIEEPTTPGVETPLDGLVRSLREEHNRLLEQIQTREKTERALSSDAYEEPSDPGDRGNALQQAYLEDALVDLAVRRIHQIDRALARHARGELGCCSGCGRPIPLARLRILPGADHCVMCANRESLPGVSGRRPTPRA